MCDALIGGGDVTIFSGGADGTDLLGEQYAADRGYPIKKFPADWGLHGKAAGPIRNRQMAERADMLIAFWDGESPGTRNMLRTAESLALDWHLIKYKEHHPPTPHKKKGYFKKDDTITPQKNG